MNHHSLRAIVIGAFAVGGGSWLFFPLIKGLFIKHISRKVIVHTGREYLKDKVKDKAEEQLFSKKDRTESN